MSWLTFRHEAMATHFEIHVADQREDYSRQAAAAAFRELDRLESELSRFIETSDISRANRLARGESTRIGPDTFECLLVAADASLATQRAFDPAYASLREPSAPPDTPAFTLDPDAHTVTSQVARLQLDLGAVGKGFALDRMADVLREWQIDSACLNGGGSTALALAPPPGEVGWPVGIGEGRHHRTVSLAHLAVSGSGLAVKGEHISNPHTGQPARRRSRVWSCAATAALADALSTAFFVMADVDIETFCATHASIGGAVTASEGRVIAIGRFRALPGDLDPR